MSNMQSETLPVDQTAPDKNAISFCEDFISGRGAGRFVFGTNPFAASIASRVNVDGFIDDFRADISYEGKPILRTEAIPDGALVVAAVALRPQTVRRKLLIRHL